MSIKVAWPYDPSDVADDLRRRASASTGGAAERARRSADAIDDGIRSVRRGKRVLELLGKGTASAARLADRALSPTTLGPALLRGAGNVGRAVLDSPTAMTLLGATALSAPIILSDVPRVSHAVADGILAARQDPRRLVEEERDVMASLDTFLEKKAGFLSPGVTRGLRDFAVEGLAKGVGSEVAQGLMFGASRLAQGVGSALFGDPKKKAILEKLLTTDQIISDAVRRNPASKDQILEAFATLQRFAPSLAADLNAVRSFLREVVLGGGNVNYATIKNLIDTEKSLHGNSPVYKGVL